MADLSSQTSVASHADYQAKSSALKVYLRLVGYAWQYKGRLLISLLFAVLIAISFGTMLVSVGSMIKLTFYEAPTEQVQGEDAPQDPALKMAEDIAAVAESLRATIGWAPENSEARFLKLVEQMRMQKTKALSWACMLIFILALTISIARFLQEYFAGVIGANISADLGQAMYENVVRQPLGFFESRGSGDILGRFTNDIFMVNRGLAGVFVKLMREPIKAVTFLAVAFSVDIWLTLTGLCVLPPLAYALTLLGKKVRKSVRRSLQKVATMASVVNETITGMAIIKGFNMEEYESGRVGREVKKLRRYLKKTVKADAATGPISEFILILGIIVFVLFSARRVESGLLDAADLVKLYFALAMMLDPVRKLSSVNNMIQTSVASAERVFEFIDLKPDIKERTDAPALQPLQHSLSFDHVHFSYDGKKEVLKDLSFDIKKGEMLAVVGSSGAGKSTLAKLIPRFYDVTAGAITIDGVDIREVSSSSLREQLSIVTQSTVLFAESVRDNIAFGRTTYSDERVRQAAQAAHADTFIEALSQGYDTVIGEHGANLSGGQQQRLAIARAIIKDPAFLILDEATSSLDSESERHIQQALDAFVVGRTTLVIAHRLSTIQRADRILVLDDGCLAEEGTHAELLARGGIYKRLYDTQFGETRSS